MICRCANSRGAEPSTGRSCAPVIRYPFPKSRILHFKSLHCPDDLVHDVSCLSLSVRLQALHAGCKETKVKAL